MRERDQGDSPIDTTVLVAVIAAAASIVAAVVSGVFASRNRRLTAEETSRQAEITARRDYEYEARKRLYNAYEPLRFHLVDAAEAARARIQILFESACTGTIIEEASRGYYLKATMYHLLVPCAIVRLMERRLTLIDLGIIPRIHTEYKLGKAVVRSFTDDDFFAELAPSLDYSPYVKDWKEKRPENPQKYRRQGLPVGRLDNSLDALIARAGSSKDDVETIISFGEFEKRYDETLEEDYAGNIGAPRDLFFQFHPFTRPVLWRILMTQMVIYEALLELTERQHPSDPQTVLEMLDEISRRRLSNFSHREDKDSVVRDPKSQSIISVKASIPEVTEVVLSYIHLRVRPSLSRISQTAAGV